MALRFFYRSHRDSGGLRACLSFRYVLEQIRIDEILVSRAHAVRQARVNFESGVLHNLGRHERSDSDRHDRIIVAMHDERRHVELLKIFREVEWAQSTGMLSTGSVIAISVRLEKHYSGFGPFFSCFR